MSIVQDVLIAPHCGVPNDPDETLIWYLENRLRVSDDIWVGQIDDRSTIMYACEPAGYSMKGEDHKWQPDRQFGAYYAIGRDNPPRDNPFSWDPDGRLLMTVAFSRLVHPTALGFEYAARVEWTEEGTLDTVMPFPGERAYTVTDLPLIEQRHWLTRNEWTQVGRMLDAWPNCNARNRRRVNRCKWHFEIGARMRFLEVRWELLIRAMKALVGVDFDTPHAGGRGARFKQATRRLSEECNDPIDDADLDRAWDMRSRVTHGQDFPKPRCDDPGACAIADGGASVYVKIEHVLRQTLKCAILDDSFAAHFETADSIEEWLCGRAV